VNDKYPLKKVSFRNAIYFVIFVGSIATLHNYYFFSSTQIDQWPMVYREIDPNFLINDFFTNASATFNEDFIFAKVLAWFSNLMPLYYAVFVLTLISNIGIGITSFLMARDFSGKNNTTGMLAAVLVLTLSTFQWGNRDFLFRADLTPEHLIMPLILLSIWKGMKQQPLLTGLFAGIATFIHPLTGPGIGGLMLLQILFTQIYRRQLTVQTTLRLVYAGFMMLGPLLLYLVPYFKSFDYKISDELFVQVMTMRFPHHYLASHFITPLKTFIGVCFLLASYFSWKKTMRIKNEIWFSVFPLAIMLSVLSFLGWVFSDIWPQRLMFTLHPFRFFTIFKFIGLIAIAMYTGLILHSAKSLIGKVNAVLVAFFPPLFLLHHLILKDKLKGNLSYIIFVSYLAILYLLSTFIRSYDVTFFLCGTMLLILIYNLRFYRIALALLIVGMTINMVLLPQLSSKLNKVSYLQKFRPHITLDSYSDSGSEIANYIKYNTPENSLILVPPREGYMRIMANRALVVDGYSIPMNDRGIEEWWYRMNKVYNMGESEAPLTHIRETYANYMELTDEDLLLLKNEFNFQYAVVRTSASTQWPILYKNKEYKLLDFSNSRAK